VFQAPIVTSIELARTFYRAEDHPAKNLGYPYMVFDDLTKIANLKRLFPSFIAPTRCWSASSARRMCFGRQSRLPLYVCRKPNN
jgi:hypothetical protein